MKKIVAILCLMMLTAPYAGAAEKESKNERRGAHEMTNKKEITNKDAWALYDKYVQGWNAESVDMQKKIIVEVTADNIEYRTRNHDLGGRAEIIEDIATFHKKFPGGHFEIGDVSTHHDFALLTWVIVQADGKEVARGHDQLRVNAEGKISSLITFPPSAKTP